MNKYNKPEIVSFIDAHKTMSKRALAKLLADEFDEFDGSIEKARHHLRRITGNMGGYNAEKASRIIPDTFGKLPEEAPEIPTEHYQIPTSIKHLGIIADLHSVFFDREATFTALEHLKKKDVDAILINGDMMDFYQQSSFQKHPYKAHFTAERKWGLTMLQLLQSEFGTVYYKKGNHENRLEHYMMRNAPAVYDDELMTLEHILHFGGSKVNFIHDAQIIDFGKLRILHGHEIRGGGFINVSRNKYLRSYANVLFAHHHQVNESYVKDLDGRYEGAWSIGCLCQTAMGYAPINQWMHGFAEVKRSDDRGNFRVYNHKIIEGKVS